MTGYSPLVLDTSALLLLAQGHPRLMRMLDDAEDGHLQLIIPAMALYEAEALLSIGFSAWERFLRFRGVQFLPLGEHIAAEAAGLIAPALRAGLGTATPMTLWMIGQAVWEAQAHARPDRDPRTRRLPRTRRRPRGPLIHRAAPSRTYPSGNPIEDREHTMVGFIRREIVRRRASQARLIRMRALLDTERDYRRLGIEPSEEVQAEIRELFDPPPATGAETPPASVNP